MVPRKKIGVIGSGSIASRLIRTFQQSGEIDIGFVLVRMKSEKAELGLQPGVLVTDPEEAMAIPVDLVVEAAVPQVLQLLAPGFLLKSDFCAFSTTALAEESFERTIRETCERSGHRFFVPHGAILGLDGIADGRSAISEVVITTKKNGQSLGLDAAAEGVVFEGSVRDACLRFPRNVNVHAAVAAAGIGFDRTESRIVATPDDRTMRHHIAVKGEGLSWDIHVSSESLGGVTGSYTPLSSIGSVRRILGGSGLRIA